MDAIKGATEGMKNASIQDAPIQKPQPQKKDKKEKKDNKKGGNSVEDSGPLELEPAPEYIAHRVKLFEKLKAEYDDEIAQKPRDAIEIKLGNDRLESGNAWETTPASVAKSISSSLSKRVVVARVDGDLWDLDRPLEGNCRLELLEFDHEEGKKVFWHSSAHILGEAAELRFGCHLCIGPPVQDGFYYEMSLPDGGVVQQSDWQPLKTIAEKAIRDKQPFERLVLSKENLLEMFRDNKYKQHIIKDKIADGTNTTVYRCGPLIDLCRGPHVPDTGRIKAFEIMKVRTQPGDGSMIFFTEPD